MFVLTVSFIMLLIIAVPSGLSILQGGIMTEMFISNKGRSVPVLESGCFRYLQSLDAMLPTNFLLKTLRPVQARLQRPHRKHCWLKVKVKVTLRLTVSQSVCLGVEPKYGTFDQIFFFFLKVTVLSFLGRPL
jgi:hypothetical protein